MAKFEPTEEQRQEVALRTSMARWSQEEIAKAIVNPRTKRPISVKTLCRVFKQELSADTEFLKPTPARFREKVTAG